MGGQAPAWSPSTTTSPELRPHGARRREEVTQRLGHALVGGHHGGLEEEVEDPLLGEDARHEREVALLVLHAVHARLVALLEPQRDGDLRLAEHLADDLRDGHVLEDAAHPAAGEEREAGHEARPHAARQAVAGGVVAAERRHHAVHHPRHLQRLRVLEARGLSEEVGLERLEVHALELERHVPTVGLRERLAAAEGHHPKHAIAVRPRVHGEQSRRFSLHLRHG
jgi:hypothetical protein